MVTTVLGMMKRIFSMWIKNLSKEDTALINTYLDDSGKFLFYQMSRIDQHHALDVARIIITEAPDSKLFDQPKLIKAALLHDIGKVAGDFSFCSRILVGFIRRTKPTLRGKLAFTNPTSFWERVGYGFYVDLVHPARGAHMAKIFGVEPTVVEMIRHHHDPPHEGQSVELTWLQLADSRN